MQVMAQKALEGSSYFVTVNFKDETGAAITPNTALWSLRTMDGSVVNGRTSVTMTALASTKVIVLSGDDLEIGTDDGKRLIVVWGTYDSIQGNDLPFYIPGVFDIEAIPGN